MTDKEKALEALNSLKWGSMPLEAWEKAMATIGLHIEQSDPARIREETLDEVEGEVDEMIKEISHPMLVAERQQLITLRSRIRSLRDQEGEGDYGPVNLNDVEPDPLPEKVKGGEDAETACYTLMDEYPDSYGPIERRAWGNALTAAINRVRAHPAPSQPDSEGTREDGIRECVGVVNQYQHSEFYPVANSTEIGVCHEIERRLTALLDKPQPEPELTWDDAKVRDTFRARHNTGSEHSFFKYHDEGAVRIGYPHQGHKTYPEHLFNGRAWTILSIDQAEGENEHL